MNTFMTQEPLFDWRAREYEFDDKPSEWYWALAIIAIGAIITSILFKNYLLAVVFAAAGFAIGIQAAKEPHEHHFRLTKDGLYIDHRLYPFDLMHSFSVIEYFNETKPMALSIKTHSLLSPHLMIPLVDVNIDELYAFMFAYVEEGEHKEMFVDRLIDFFRL